MINRINLLRNVGLFDSVSSGATIPLTRFTLVYAENGRGKTTLAAILRSLATGNPISIAERRRLAAQHPPHVVLDCDGGPPAAVFENNAWNRTLPNMAVFDDVFVDENVCSGLTVEPEHRQNLHELILGAHGVSLNRQLQELIKKVETHNSAVRTKSGAIPAAERGALSVDQFCDLKARADIDEAIQAAERKLAAAREQDSIRSAAAFQPLSLPAFDIPSLDQILQQHFPSIDAAATARVQSHLARLGQGGESWIADGIRRIRQQVGDADTCPFCAQNLAGSPVLEHYRTYFSDAYAELKRNVSETLELIKSTHGSEVPVAFERNVRILGERRQFWAQFCEVPDVSLDTATISRDWHAAREAVLAALAAKQSAPLDPIGLDTDARNLVATYEIHRLKVTTLNQQLRTANEAIRIVKEQAAMASPATLAADLAQLKASKARHKPTIAALCTEYLNEKQAKAQTEELRDQVRMALDQHRTNVFPGYQSAINLYLEKFNAGFRLDNVTYGNTRTGPTCTYKVIINKTSIPIAGGTPTQGEPSFRNTLSAGDRNTLALAFFFASLDQDPAMGTKIVVIDDPISSLDEHRTLRTVQEVRQLADRVVQVIVLSHSKPFLCHIWEGGDHTVCTALEVIRDGIGSTIRPWDVSQDSISEHDQHHTMLRTYLGKGTSNQREVARSIRPLLEGFLRVANPEHFPPGTLLGQFQHICKQRVGTSQEILNAKDTLELAALIEYTNKFHHAAWRTQPINDSELADFIRRALAFARRAP